MKYNLFYYIIFSFIPLSGLAQLQANFSADTTRGCGTLPGVQFTDLSTGNPTSWLWEFGNGNTSPLQNPVESFTALGQYTIKLTVTNSGGNSVESKTNYIKVFRSPNAQFTVANNIGCPPLPVTFTSTSSIGDAAISNYSWDFGDGSQAGSGANTTHLYQTGGSYPVSLVVTDLNNCTDNETFNSVTVTNAPNANFNSINAPTSCTAPYTVNFNNLSSGTGLSYEWQFGDGATSTLINPSHTYNTLGKYTVTLIVNDANCADTTTKIDFVELAATNAQFTTNDTICFGTPFSPINYTVGATNYLWNYGDGNSELIKDPNHIYADTGWFVVRLLATNGPICNSSMSDSVYVQRITSSFTSFPKELCQPSDTTYLTANSNLANRYYWKLGTLDHNDSLTSDSIEGKVLKFTGRDFGIFDDTLIVISKAGCRDTSIILANRTIIEQEISFAKETLVGCSPAFVDFYYHFLGTGDIISWKWTLPDSSILTTSSIDTITYQNRGIYEYSLEITTDSGCVGKIFKTVSVGEKQTPDYIILDDTICPNEDLIFINKSTDSALINEINVTIGRSGVPFEVPDSSIQFFKSNYFDTLLVSSFIDTGYYRLNMAVIDNGCLSKIEEDSLFYVEGPIVDATFYSSCDSLRNTINFFGNLKQATKFYWDFGDGSPIDSINLNPIHNYVIDSVYTVRFLGVSENTTCDTSIFEIEIDLKSTTNFGFTNLLTDLCVGEIIPNSITDPLSIKSYLWLKDNDTISNSAYYIDTLLNKDSYNLSVFITDLIGCNDTLSKFVNVYDPKANFTSDVRSGCLPFSVQFNNTSSFDTTVVWSWRLGDGDTSIIQNPLVTYQTNGPKDIFLKVENVFGCQDSILKQAYINSGQFSVSFTESDVSICQYDSIYFNNRSIGTDINYQWNIGNETRTDTGNFYHTFNTAGVYDITLTATDTNGCAESVTKQNRISVEAKPIANFSSDTSGVLCAPIQVNFVDETVGNVNSWHWDLGFGAPVVFQNPLRTYTSQGKYDISLIVETPNGCKDTIVKSEYIQTNKPTASYSINKGTICLNESIQFEITSTQNVSNFLWTFGDGGSDSISPVNHTYIGPKTGKIFPTLTVIDSIGCDTTYIDSIFVQNVAAKISLSDSLGCGIPNQIQISNNSIGADQFSWQIDNQTFTQNNFSYNFQSYGTYPIELIISSNIGCKDTAQKTIQIAPVPIPKLSSDTGICIGDSVILNANGGDSYLWKPNFFLSSNTDSTVIAKPDSTVTYNVIISNTAGCKDSAQVEIIVPQSPTNYQLLDSTIYVGEEIQGNIFVGNSFNYTWTPPDGLSCTNCPNPTIKPNIDTEYFINIFDDFGCFNIIDTVNITVLDAFSLNVPKAFSPNGDLVNDIIYARGWGIKELVAFRIYNRFGELVFESTDESIGWDGTYKGKPQAIETYIYTVEALGYNGETLQKKGNIALIR